VAAPSASAVPDILAPGLRCVFCGINPGRRSSAAGHHFANPRNDFWRLLADSGLTPRRLDPAEQWDLLELGYGLTNAAHRTTRGSGDRRRADFEGAAERLDRIAAELRPGVIAFVGKAAYQGAFGLPRCELGLRERGLGETRLFVLPSTSPANAAVSYAVRLEWFVALARFLKEVGNGRRLPDRPHPLRSLFVNSGVMAHLVGYRQGVQYAKSYNVPLAELGVPLTGVVAVLGGLSVILGVWGDLGALLIAGFLVLITPLMHAFWRETDEMQRLNQMVNFTKNTALLGGALVLFYVWNQLQGDAGLSLTDALFSRW
jgi:double-stranded uracil-DNA glycosylase